MIHEERGSIFKCKDTSRVLVSTITGDFTPSKGQISNLTKLYPKLKSSINQLKIVHCDPKTTGNIPSVHGMPDESTPFFKTFLLVPKENDWDNTNVVDNLITTIKQFAMIVKREKYTKLVMYRLGTDMGINWYDITKPLLNEIFPDVDILVYYTK